MLGSDPLAGVSQRTTLPLLAPLDRGRIIHRVPLHIHLVRGGVDSGRLLIRPRSKWLCGEKPPSTWTWPCLRPWLLVQLVGVGSGALVAYSRFQARRARHLGLSLKRSALPPHRLSADTGLNAPRLYVGVLASMIVPTSGAPVSRARLALDTNAQRAWVLDHFARADRPEGSDSLNPARGGGQFALVRRHRHSARLATTDGAQCGRGHLPPPWAKRGRASTPC